MSGLKEYERFADKYLGRFAYHGDNVQVHEPSIFLKPDAISIGDGSRLDSIIKIEGGQGVHIGKGVHISSFCHLNIGGGKLHVGDYVALTSGVKVHTGSNTAAGESMSSASPPEMQVIQRGEVTIGDYAFIGSGAQVLMGVTIGEYAVVGAGAVVTKDVAPWSVVMGLPARPVGKRIRLSNGRLAISYYAKGPELAEILEEMYP